MRRRLSSTLASYRSRIYSPSIENPEAFWLTAAQDIEWFEKPTRARAVDVEAGKSGWFQDGTLNTAYLCTQAHLNAGRGDQAAVYYDSPVTNMREAISYKDLSYRVDDMAAVLRDQYHVGRGDTVVIYVSLISSYLGIHLPAYMVI